MENWRQIVLRLGVDDFGYADVICGLHFKESDIERERLIYASCGKSFKVPLKRYELRHNAVPTIFPSKIPRNERLRKRLQYALKSNVDPQIIRNEKEMLTANNTENLMKIKSPTKRKIMDDVEIKSQKELLTSNITENVMKVKSPTKPKVSDDEEIRSSLKVMKTNDVFDSTVTAITNGEKLSPFLNNNWISNITDKKFIRWSLWKFDHSGEEKCVILFHDLTVEVRI